MLLPDKSVELPNGCHVLLLRAPEQVRSSTDQDVMAATHLALHEPAGGEIVALSSSLKLDYSTCARRQCEKKGANGSQRPSIQEQ